MLLWAVSGTFGEENSVKSKTLGVIILVLASSSALAQTPGTFSFWNAAGTLEYCNYNVIAMNSGGVVAGTDNLVTFCNYTYNSALIGLAATTPNLGLPAYGKGAVLGDGIYDSEDLGYTGLQWTMWQSTRVSKKKQGFFTGRYGWIGVAGSFSGFYFGDNFGFLSAGLPVNGAGHGTTAGKWQKSPGIPAVW